MYVVTKIGALSKKVVLCGTGFAWKSTSKVRFTGKNMGLEGLKSSVQFYYLNQCQTNQNWAPHLKYLTNFFIQPNVSSPFVSLSLPLVSSLSPPNATSQLQTIFPIPPPASVSANMSTPLSGAIFVDLATIFDLPIGLCYLRSRFVRLGE